MVHLIIVRKELPVIRLARVQETTSGKVWIFDFVDPVHGMAQSVIMPKFCEAGHMEACYERIWEKWAQHIRETEWKAGEA